MKKKKCGREPTPGFSFPLLSGLLYQVDVSTHGPLTWTWTYIIRGGATNACRKGTCISMIGAASLPSYMLKTAMARWIVRTMCARVHAILLDGAGQVGKRVMPCTVLWV